MQKTTLKTLSNIMDLRVKEDKEFSKLLKQLTKQEEKEVLEKEKPTQSATKKGTKKSTKTTKKDTKKVEKPTTMGKPTTKKASKSYIDLDEIDDFDFDFDAKDYNNNYKGLVIYNHKTGNKLNPLHFDTDMSNDILTACKNGTLKSVLPHLKKCVYTTHSGKEMKAVRTNLKTRKGSVVRAIFTIYKTKDNKNIYNLISAKKVEL